MANILIADLREQSAYLLKAIYKGYEHKSIIAIDAQRAKALLETGVFDMLVADLTVADVEVCEIVKLANELIPVMPIIAVVAKDHIDEETENAIFAKINRPIDTKNIEETLTKAVEHIEITCVNKRSDKRAEVSLPVLMKHGNTPIPAQGKDLSTNGIAIDVPENADFKVGQIISAMIQLPEDSLEVTGIISFVKHENSTQTIGLKFDSKKTIRFRQISNYLSEAS